MTKTRALAPSGDIVGPSTWDDQTMSLEIAVATEAPVEQWGNIDGQWGPYDEVLLCNPDTVDATRFNGGAAPVLMDHLGMSRMQIGAVVPGSVRFEGGEMICRIMLTADPEKAGIVGDIKAGIRRTWSVGYNISAYDVSKDASGRVRVTANNWTPYEVSSVPMPADMAAQSRSLTVPPEVPAQMTLTPAQPDGADIMSMSPEALRARNAQIRKYGQAANLPAADIDAAIDDLSVTPEAFAARALELRAEADAAAPKISSFSASVVESHDNDHAAAVDAVVARVNGTVPTERARAMGYGSKTMLELGEQYCQRRGMQFGNMTRTEKAQAILGVKRSYGMHTTSDFANVVLDAANKVALQGYTEAPQKWLPLASVRTVNDFKNLNLVGLGDAALPTVLPEGGKIEYQTTSDRKQTVALGRWGAGFIYSYQAMVNDDLGLLQRIPQLFGSAMARKENATVWALITSGASTGVADGGYLIRAANTGSSNGAPTAARLGELRKIIMTAQAITSDSSAAPLNLEPRYILCPPSLTPTIEPLIGLVRQETLPASNVPNSLSRLQIIEDAYLEANSDKKYYMAADPGQVDMLCAIRLAGAESPVITTELDFDSKGLKIACEHNFAACALDSRGFAYNAGQ